MNKTQDFYSIIQMKKRITTYALLLSMGLFAMQAQDDGNSFVNDDITDSSNTIVTNYSTQEFVEKDKTFEEEAKANNIPNRSFETFEGADSGYYVIAGVYSKGGKRLDKTVKKFKKKGFDSGVINKPDNGLNYLYLKHSKGWRAAIDACISDLDGNYEEDVWILKVGNMDQEFEDPTRASDSPNLSEDIVSENKVKDKTTYDVMDDLDKETTSIVTISDTASKSKLVQKADHYFDKMWYAEAAELYEQALQKNEKNYSYEIIQKVGDAHYFNTNMEKAYQWYDILYDKYGKDMSADNVFKYAHTLKGTGKYARAKRLMRLYNRKTKNGDVSNIDDNDATATEMVLDNILSTEKNFDIKNMAVNTEYSDFSPMFLDSNQVVFASARDSSFFNTRRYKWNDQPYLDLYVAKINEESQDLKDALKFSKKINTKYHEASVTFSPDNSTMYFTRNNYGKKLKRDKNGVNHLKIYRSTKVDGEWSEAEEVPFNSDDYSTGHPALSPDGKQLYFVSDMPGSIGETDIFVVDVLEGGSFSEARNLGPEINTEKKEMFPFINDKKLYFSSNGHTGLGGLDVFEVAYDDEEGFQEVVNVGRPVNSNLDDFSYIVDEETQKGFLPPIGQAVKGMMIFIRSKDWL
ncbi:cell envelope biogenesis protein OmpA [Maribacter halichondriae]|uniref:cell envelope biogenesis protein OmpA n=1 Tax=Maribacter halichondriae TaxID=2980554 RepID=UPI0023588D44|nr:cell envelope biogenesis protein OmpA [Maribacter sp. Hal144]